MSQWIRSATARDTFAAAARTAAAAMPPGQRAVEGFPRFGTHFQRPAPPIPVDPAIDIGGAVVSSFSLPLIELAALPRRELTADLHCVAGWSATNLRWAGVPFETVYRRIIEPALQPSATISHVVFEGLDGYRSTVLLEDALAEEVLIAEHLNGEPLDSDHGAPVRLISPNQYGFISTKHLCRIEVHTTEPENRYHPSPVIQLGLSLVKPHPRARVWQEERHRYLPARTVRPLYRLLIRPFKFLSARGSQLDS
jgi:DMSO/TMAO reductase YedYZ molybdopterin-dependent catalytic subunit